MSNACNVCSGRASDSAAPSTCIVLRTSKTFHGEKISNSALYAKSKQQGACRQLATAVATPITALFVYPKGQGTCDATTSLLRFLATEAPTPAPAPAPAPEPSFAPNPANSHALLPGLGPAFGPAFAPANAPVVSIVTRKMASHL